MQPLAGRADLSTLNCSLAGALNLVGDWWTLLIVRDAALGACRFGEFQQSLGLAKNILADRLQRLVQEAVLERHGTERRPIYRLTDKGWGLLPALVALMQWGDAWVSGGEAPVEVVDGSGRVVAPVRIAGRDGPVAPRDIRFRAGPGAEDRTRAFLAMMAAREPA
jgi:DNA-binding HxlR family transcriptional regulator